MSYKQMGSVINDASGTAWFFGNCEHCGRQLVASITNVVLEDGEINRDVGLACAECMLKKMPLDAPEDIVRLLKGETAKEILENQKGC